MMSLDIPLPPLGPPLLFVLLFVLSMTLKVCLLLSTYFSLYSVYVFSVKFFALTLTSSLEPHNEDDTSYAAVVKGMETTVGKGGDDTFSAMLAKGASKGNPEPSEGTLYRITDSYR